jgi:uncharacterized membrane protein YfcA
MTQFLYIITGIVVGTLSGLLGIGGGIILVPIFILAFDMKAQAAVATSLIALLLPVGALGVYQFWRTGIISSEHFKIGLTIAIGIFFGAFFGSKLAIYLPEKILRYLFGIILFLVGFKVIFK